MNEHPSFVFIPDSSTEGVRAYREPAVAHRLQLAFLEEAGERAYVENVRGLLSAGRLDEADALLTADLAGFEGRLARLCRATPREAVTIEGWEDLLPILDEHEGPPITAITIGMSNDSDLVFDKDGEHEPALVVALYSDDSYPFSSSDPAAILAECLAEDPVFAGHDEDVEFYAVAAGLAPLNTALVQSMHRHFLRDGRDGVEGRAPGGYVEYVLATWLRGLRFLQALSAAAHGHGIPPGARLIAGTAGLGTDFACLLGEGGRDDGAADRAGASTPTAALTMKKWEPKHDPLADDSAGLPILGSAIRRRIAEPEGGERSAGNADDVEGEVAGATPPVTPPSPKPGLLARLFGRRGH